MGKVLHNSYCVPIILLGTLTCVAHATTLTAPPIAYKPYGQLALKLPNPWSTPLIRSKHLSLKEAILLALRHNPNIVNATLDRVSQKFALEDAHSEFTPDYFLEASNQFQRAQKPYYSITPRVNLKTKLGTELGLTLDQGFFGSGQSLSAGTLFIKQPLLRGSGKAVVTANLHNAEDTERINQLVLKNTYMQMITRVIQDYYQLAQSLNQLTIQQMSLKQSLSNLKRIQLNINTGKLAPAQAIHQNAQIAAQRLSIQQQHNTIKQRYQTLLITLGLRPESRIVIDRNISGVSHQMRNVCISNKRPKLFEETTAHDLALRNNVNYQIALITLNQTRRNLWVARNDQLWKLDLTASATEEFSHRHNSTVLPFASVNERLGDRKIALNLSVPIDETDRKIRLANARITLQKQKVSVRNQRRLLSNQVINFIRDLASQRRQIVLAEKAVTLARNDYHNALLSWRYGKITLFEVTSKRTTLENAKVAWVNEKINYLITQARFHQFLGMALRCWDIKIRDYDRLID